MRKFSHFACIDWSGAKTERPGGIAMAVIGSSGAPKLIKRKQPWSRPDILEWLRQHAANKSDILIGFDLSFAVPFFDNGSYFPEWGDSPSNGKQLWTLVDRICAADPYLGANSFLKHPQAERHFRHGKGKVGDLFRGGTGRLRVVEQYQRDTEQGNSASCFNLVGAAQVGKSSLTGMRMLNQLDSAIPVWPFDAVPETGPVIVEIYTAVAALAAGIPKGRSKVRDREGLRRALDNLNTPCPARLAVYDDHSTDALITATWMKQAADRKALWNPPMLTNEIAEKEGWTFGII